MNQYLRKRLVLSKCRFYNRNFLNSIAITERNLTINQHGLVELQWRKLKDLLHYAYYNCPFYYEKYSDVGLRPESIRNLEDFRSVPILTKSEIRDNLPKMIPHEIDESQLEEVHTSGTTGFPLKIYRDRSKKNLMNALYARTIRFWGCDLGSKTVWMWGVPDELKHLNDYRHQSRVRRFLKNEAWFDAFDITEENMLQFSQFLNNFAPDLIISHVSMIYKYARFLDENNIRVVAPRAIWITAEPAYSSQREFIENIFRAKTYNQYGLSEILHIAAECSKRDGLHIHADSRYIEILDSNDKPLPPGELGSIVITDLENKVMPLIRYKNGDLSSLQRTQCSCGLSLPLLSNIEGRILDTIRLKDGKSIYGHIFARILFEHVDQIREFQIHQNSLHHIIIRIVPSQLCDFDRLKSIILRKLQKYTKNMISYSFQLSERIEREKSGKMRSVKSDV